MTDLRWVPPDREHDGAWLDLLAAMESVDQRGETYELDDLADEWASIWSHPETDATFVWDGSELVGFVWLKAMPGERSAHKVSCWGGVRPSRRRQGIGSQLFEWMLHRATEVSATFGGDLPTTIETDATDHQADVAVLARRFDFEPVRRFLEVARPTVAPVLDLPAVAGLELASWSADIDEEARLAHMEAFADHWGSEPRSREAWEQWYTGHRSFRSDLSVLAVEPTSGQVVSLVLTAAYPQDWDTVPVEAWINTVGTRRPWRGKGVARWLTAEVLRRIAASDTGFERTILGVDAENPTGALRLYRDLGFHDDVRAATTLSRPPL